MKDIIIAILIIIGIIAIPIIITVVLSGIFELGLMPWEKISQNIPSSQRLVYYFIAIAICYIIGISTVKFGGIVRRVEPSWLASIMIYALFILGSIISTGSAVLSFRCIIWAGYGWILLWNVVQFLISFSALLVGVIGVYIGCFRPWEGAG